MTPGSGARIGPRQACAVAWFRDHGQALQRSPPALPPPNPFLPMKTARLFRLLPGWLLCTVGVALTATATSIRPPSFEHLTAQSGKIVRATVHAVRPYEDWHDGKQIVRTEVTLNVLESLRGDVPTGALSIHYLGGEIPGLRLEVGAMPRFEVGRELVLFLHGEGRFICPTVGWGHGQYGVDRGGRDGIARIRRADGGLLTSLKQVSEPFHGTEGALRPATTAASGVGMSLAAFRQAVLDQVETGRQQR